MKTTIAILSAMLFVSGAVAGVYEVARSPTRTHTVATSTTNTVFTNTMSGTFGWQLLAVDVWNWNGGATNTDYTLTVKVIPETDSYTNDLVTLTNAIQGADITITNGTASLTYNGNTGPILANSECIQLKPSASNQTFKASIKYGVFMRQ